MNKPILLALDDDPDVLAALRRDLRAAYRNDYRILGAASGSEALEALEQLKLQGEPVALLLSDQRMPEMLGVDFLVRARELHPEARRVLLTAYSDIDAAIRAINEVELDYYLTKPWDPPEEKLYPVLGELLDEWRGSYRPPLGGIRVVGYQWSPRSHAVKDFLAGNLIPYHWLDVETAPAARELLALAEIAESQLPAVFFEDGSHLVNPAPTELAERVGMTARASGEVYDVVIVGGGPAGLAAAVYGASEGLKTLLLERRAPGGQAGTSSRIENYLGFPSGISGAELSRRALAQATRLGAEVLTPQDVRALKTHEGYHHLELGDGSTLHARSVVIATGVDYRRLETPGIEPLTGRGVYYGAAATEASACVGCPVCVVGGGNSAGQAAVYLSKFAARVHVVIRRDSLAETMSKYLIDQLAGTSNVELVPRTVVAEARGEERLEQLVLENLDTGEPRTIEAVLLFIFIGARPYTDWLASELIVDRRGFILTGAALEQHPEFRRRWPLKREPFLLESSRPGVFAAGDVRAGAMNRVASAVGEGAMAIKLVHEFLAGV